MRTVLLLVVLVGGCATPQVLTPEELTQFRGCRAFLNHPVDRSKDPARATACEETMARLARVEQERIAADRERRDRALREALVTLSTIQNQQTIENAKRAEEEQRTVRCRSRVSGNQIDTTCRESPY